MKATYSINETFKCSLERAFRTPMHGDATQILTGYGIIPKLVGFAKDETWGVAGGSRIPIMAGNIFVKSGEYGFDEIIERKDHEYWQWRVSKFGASMFFAKYAKGEWWAKDNANGTIDVKWKYSLISRNVFTQPITWLFVKLVWRNVMKNGMIGIKRMAEADAPFVYNK